MDANYFEKLPGTWLEDRLRRIKLPWLRFAVLVPLLILILEIPHDIRYGVDKFLHTVAFDCVIIGYSLASWAITKYFLAKCLKSLAPLINEPVPDALNFSAREWQFTFGIGGLLTLMANINAQQLGSWITWLNLLSAFIAYSTFGWLIFAYLASAKQITQFIVRVTLSNIFDASPFRSVAYWCLSVAAVIMGAITIASLFLGGNILETVNLITYGLAGLLGIFVFFAGMWSTHQHMLNNKEREINHINEELHSLHAEILSGLKDRDLEKSRALMEASAGLTAYKERIEKVPDWPYTIGSIGGLASSVTIPVVINLLSKIF
jgi:hypothetical protein